MCAWREGYNRTQRVSRGLTTGRGGVRVRGMAASAVGQRYGSQTCIADPGGGARRRVRVRCDCGAESDRPFHSWRYQAKESCRKCCDRSRVMTPDAIRAIGRVPLEDRIRERHGKLVVTAILRAGSNAMVRTQCDCGRTWDTYLNQIIARGASECPSCARQRWRKERPEWTRQSGAAVVADHGKPLGLRLRLYNAALVRARKERGCESMAAAVQRYSLPGHVLAQYESLRRSPVDVHGRWLPSALEIANAYGVAPETLWPSVVQRVRRAEAEIGLDEADVAMLAPPADMEAALDAKRTAELVRAVLHGREQDVIMRRFGLDGDGEHSLVEIGAMLGVSRERARQIEEQALRKLADKMEP